MDHERRARHASSFGTVSHDYDAARPSYPADAVAWLTGPAPLDVLDLGAGTGKLTEQLVAAGHRVSAVDPSEGMLAQLRARLPSVTVAQGPAESVPLPDHAYDVVTAAQAWHWFDQPAATRESARVLRPGGRLALVWNQRDETHGWVGAAWAPITRDGSVGMALLADDWTGELVAEGLFGPVERATFHHEQQLSRDGVLRLIASRSSLAVMDAEQRDAVLTEVGEILDNHPESRGQDLLTIPYDVHCFRWRRSG
jgi:SAM-dependent methyltransferase